MVESLSKAMASFTSEGSWYYYWVFGIAVGGLLALTILFPGWRKKRANLPPSPGALPIVGSFPFMRFKPGEPIFMMFTRLAEKFGPITYLQMGSRPTILVSNAEIAKLVLKDHDQIFSSRPNLSAAKSLGLHFMVFTPSGAHHRRLRKIYKELLAPKRISDTHATRENELFVTLRDIYQLVKEGEEIIDLSSLLRDLSLSTIMNMICGWKGGYKMVGSLGSVQKSDLTAVLGEMNAVAMQFNFGDYFPIAGWLDLQGLNRRLKKIHKKMKAFGATLIGEYERSSKKSPDSTDSTFLDVLLSFEGADKITLEVLTGIMFDLIVAGILTTGHLQDRAIAELQKQPDLLRRLQAELDTVIGKDRFVTEADIASLPFLQAIVKETMRLNPLPLAGVPHFSTADCKIAGYDIPAGTVTILDIMAINRDPKHWPEPLRFNPDRFFMQEESDLSPFGSAYHFLPFSSGRRMCPGMFVGLTSVELVVANFMHAFEFHAPNVIDEAKAGIPSTPAQELCVSATPRLNPRVYETVLL